MFDYTQSKAWPYREAQKLISRPNLSKMDGDYRLFQTGYGPSGLPHIGTFAEVARTAMVQRAYEDMTGHETRLIVFSDDMDAMRRVPDNVPNRVMLECYVGYSLTRVPDPYEEYESFAHHNNAMLRRFLDRFDFKYEFRSATEMYRNDLSFQGALRVFHEHHDMIRDIIVPTLGEERAATYSPFLPIDPETGQVHQAKVIGHDLAGETLTYLHPETGEEITTSILNGACKLQWKADWAMRWFAQEIDYEMAGKDLIDSVKLSSQILRELGCRPPVNMIYEMFLDEHGHKISKSKGNGLTFDQWMRYGNTESLSAYLYRDPSRAKKLYPAVVPVAMDEYYDAMTKYHVQTPEQQLGNPVHHVHAGAVPMVSLPVTYQLLLNVASTAAPQDNHELARYVTNYFPMRDGSMDDELFQEVDLAFRYYEDFLKGKLNRRDATEAEANAMLDLADRINAMRIIYAHDGLLLTDENIQFEVYEVGKVHYGKEALRDWFRALYEVLLGQESGPRFGAFTVLYGVEKTVDLLRQRAISTLDALVIVFQPERDPTADEMTEIMTKIPYGFFALPGSYIVGGRENDIREILKDMPDWHVAKSGRLSLSEDS